jgi:hypothetical protein
MHLGSRYAVSCGAPTHCLAGDALCGKNGFVSYDVQLYLPEPVVVEQMLDAIQVGGKLVAHAVAPDQIEATTVGRGLHRFTVDGPLHVELEDLPEELAGRLLSATVLYEFHAPAVGAADAVRLARRLARERQGGTWDPQTGDVWAAAELRKTPRPVKGAPVDLVRFEWVVRRRDIVDAARAYLGAAAAFLPEALPVRYGEFEPMQGKYDKTRDEELVGLVADARNSVLFNATRPVLYGFVAGGKAYDPFGKLEVTVLRDALREAAWRVAAERLFVEICTRVPVVYGFAEVSRNWLWRSGGSWPVQSTPATTAYPNGISEHRWSGLHASAVWWGWYGKEYAPVLREHLPGKQSRWIGDGLFYQASEEPQSGDELDGSPVPNGYRLKRVDGRAPDGPHSLGSGWPFSPADIIPPTLAAEPPEHPTSTSTPDRSG